MAAALAATMLAGLPAAQSAGTPLSFDDALRLAIAQSPQLASDQALAEGDTIGIVPAGALPDPKLKVKVENVPTNTFERFSAKDFHEGIRVGLMQEFPGGSKRELRAQRAEREAAQGEATVEVQRAFVQRDAAAAWIDLRYAQEAARKVDEQINEAKLAVDAAHGTYRAGTLAQKELIVLQRTVVELENRRTEAEQQIRRAQIALARYVGVDADRPLGNGPDMSRLPARVATAVDPEDFPEVRGARTQEAVAAKEADLANEDYWPDWSAEIAYTWRGRAGPVVQFEPGHGVEPFQPYSQLLSLEFEFELPFFTSTRQDPRLAAKRKELDAAHASRDETKRQRIAEFGSVLADWESACAQAKRIRDELLPLVKQRREAALADYRGGTGSLTTLLAARRTELAAQLELIKQEQAAGRAWAWLAYVFPVAEKA